MLTCIAMSEGWQGSGSGGLLLFFLNGMGFRGAISTIMLYNGSMKEATELKEKSLMQCRSTQTISEMKELRVFLG